MNACLGCSRGKRKCDRARPSCSTCVRARRPCVYEGEEPALSDTTLRGGSGGFEGTGSKASTAAVSAEASLWSGLFPWVTNAADPYSREQLQRPAVDAAVYGQVLKIFGSFDRVREAVETFFDTIYPRMPVVSRTKFNQRLRTFPTSTPPADFSALCLCMLLILQYPDTPSQSMQTSLYVSVKGTISLLESVGYLSLEMVQCRLLVTFYEIGQGMSPTASISLAACAKAARALGLNKLWVNPVDATVREMAVEEKRRVWWAVFNLDRYVNLCNEDAMFGTEDPRVEDLLPIDDGNGPESSNPQSAHFTLDTPSNITVWQFARECQVSALTGRVLRHVFDPVSDRQFHADEELQLERTFRSLMALLIDEHANDGFSCAALTICTCALFTLYRAALDRTSEDGPKQDQIWQSMENASTCLTDFADLLYSNPANVNHKTLSPLTPLPVYQSALVQLQVWKRTKDELCLQRVNSLKKTLATFGERWLAARKYLDDLEALGTDRAPG